MIPTARPVARVARRPGPVLPVALLAAVLGIAACSGVAGPSAPASAAAPPSVATSPAGPSAPSPAEPTPVPTAPALTVYFTDMNRFDEGKEPYEVGVLRPDVAGPADDVARMRAVLDAFFAGPTPEDEVGRRLAAVTSGFTGVEELRIEDGVAHVRLAGACNSGGSTYTVAQALRANLVQFPDVAWVKIYDERGETERPDGQSDSIPFCLEP